MMAQRMKEALAILVLGDGVVALIAPRRHSRLWLFGPTAYRRVMRPFADRPTMTRLTAVGQILFGIWLASRQWPEDETFRG